MMNGTSVLKGYTPEIDVTIVSRILGAGGNILGKAVCESLCFSGGSHTSDTGPVRNPVRNDAGRADRRRRHRAPGRRRLREKRFRLEGRRPALAHLQFQDDLRQGHWNSAPGQPEIGRPRTHISDRPIAENEDQNNIPRILGTTR